MKITGVRLEIFTGTMPKMVMEAYHTWVENNRGCVIADQSGGVSVGYNLDRQVPIHVYYLFIWYRPDGLVFENEVNPKLSRKLLRRYLFEKAKQRFGDNHEKFVEVLSITKELLRVKEPEEGEEEDEGVDEYGKLQDENIGQD
jgi:hypothetical protein